MSVHSSTLLLIASLVSGLLCCSENGAAQNIKSDGYNGFASRRGDFGSGYNYRGIQRPRQVERPYHQDPEDFQYDSYNNDDETLNSNYDDRSADENESQQIPPQERADTEPMGMQVSASYAQPVKSERTVGRIGGYKSGYSNSYSITLQPGAIAITCTVKDPLEHIVWLRSLCPDDYDRGDMIGRGSVSNFPEVFSVSVSGEEGEFTSTLTILKPRSQMGSGVFRCEAWPHHSERRHRRQVDGEGRAGRGHHDPWNAIIVGGAEMVDECFFNGYGAGREYRAMGRNVDQSGNAIAAEVPKPTAKQPPFQQPEVPSSSNLFTAFGQPADYNEYLVQLQHSESPIDLAVADLSPVPQVEDNREQRHAYPADRSQRPYPIYEPVKEAGQPLVHYQKRRVNVQSGNPDVRADFEMSADLQVHPSSDRSRVAYSRTIQVEGQPQKK